MIKACLLFPKAGDIKLSEKIQGKSLKIQMSTGFFDKSHEYKKVPHDSDCRINNCIKEQHGEFRIRGSRKGENWVGMDHPCK